MRLPLRRARCIDCGRTQVLLASWCVPRRGHGVEVIATALAQRLRGSSHPNRPAAGRASGHRAGLAVPVARRAERLRGTATEHRYRLDPAQAPLDPTGSALGDALAALAAAVHVAAPRPAGAAQPGLG